MLRTLTNNSFFSQIFRFYHLITNFCNIIGWNNIKYIIYKIAKLLGYNKLIENLNQFRDFLDFAKHHELNTGPRKAEKDVLRKTNISSCVCLRL